MSMGKRLGAEFFGTFRLVLGSCGNAILATGFPDLGIGFAGVALAFGLTMLTMVYAVRHISGSHFNPAVTVGRCAGGRFPAKDVLPYVVIQVLGPMAAAAVLYLIASGKAGFDVSAGSFASNGYGEHSPDHYSMQAAIVPALVLTAFFLIVIHGATDRRTPAGFAGVAIGLALTLIHLVGIPFTNTSVNPARSTGVALFPAAGRSSSYGCSCWCPDRRHHRRPDIPLSAGKSRRLSSSAPPGDGRGFGKAQSAS